MEDEAAIAELWKYLSSVERPSYVALVADECAYEIAAGNLFNKPHPDHQLFNQMLALALKATGYVVIWLELDDALWSHRQPRKIQIIRLENGKWKALTALDFEQTPYQDRHMLEQEFQSFEPDVLPVIIGPSSKTIQ